MKTLGKTTWDKIKIGEVFAENGCWWIFVKVSNTHGLSLANDWYEEFDYLSGEELYPFDNRDEKLHKLSLATQRLWRED